MPYPNKKWLIVFMLLIGICLAPNRSNALQIRIQGDKLTLRAEQVFLQDILQRFVGFGVHVRIDPEINPRVSASFENRDLQKGLASILKSLDHVLIWESIQSPFGPLPKLIEVQIFEPNKKGFMQPFGSATIRSIARNPKDGSLFVKGEILLKFRPNMEISEFKRLLDQIGGVIIDSNNDLGIYKIRLPENTDIPGLLEMISRFPGIEKSEPNYVAPVPIPTKTKNFKESLAEISTERVSGDKVPVAVLDTGLAPDAGIDEFIIASLDALDPDEPITDSLGHGTQMALIAAGVIKPQGVKAEFDTHIPVIPIRAFDDNGFISNFDIMRSIDFAATNGARVLSLSWGSGFKSEFMEKAMDYASARGIVIVASGGNEPTGQDVYPAAYPSVIGVGALGPDGKSWEKSNYGDFIMYYAPGFATLPVGYKGDPGGYAGTSISAAFVANVIANYLTQNPGAKKDEILKALDSIF
ncbi:S8 family serine peptidase [Thermodesulfobacteriota bacterium]